MTGDPVAEASRSLGSRYQLLERLGSGAMGEVWRALDRTTGEHVAAKLLRESYIYDADIVTRFVRERSLLMNLQHPGIVRVRDLVVEGDQLGIVMDLIPGRDLRALLKAVGTLSARDAVSVTCAVLDAIAAAHAANILHRDIKPDNVLLVGGVPGDGTGVRLSDFGIARLAQETTVQSTGLIGTPGYMPPELFQYGRFSQASDVYAVGVLLYELLGGRTPFAGKGTVHTIGNRHVTVEPPKLPVHPLLWTVIAIMLAKDPTTRLSAAATAQALRDLPLDALEAEALAVQGEPDSWDTAQRTIVRPHPPSQLVSGDGVDTESNAAPVASPLAAAVAAATARTGPAGATSTPEVPPTATPTATPAAARSVSPPAEPSAGDGAERRRAGVRRSRRRGLGAWGVGVGAVAAVLALVLLLVVLPGRGGDETASDGPADRSGVPTQSSYGAGLQSASGLTLNRGAVYDADERQVELTLGVTFPGRAAGPLDLLVFVPPAAESGSGDIEEDATACPEVAWEGVTTAQRISAVTTGIVQSCGWAVTVEYGQGSAEVTGDVEVDLGTADDALEEWEDEARSLLSAAVSDPGNAEQVFAAQRVSGITLEVLPARLAPRASADVTVAALFPAGPQAIFTSGGQPTTALRQLSGSAGQIGIAVAPACASSVQFTPAQRLYASFETTGCNVEAQVGAFTSPAVTIAVSGIAS